MKPPSNGQSTAETSYELSPDDIKLLRHIAEKDDFIRELSAGVSGLAILNKILDEVTPTSPAKVALTWNDGLIAGWREANKRATAIGKATTCFDILNYIERNAPASEEFFKKVADARGCND